MIAMPRPLTRFVVLLFLAGLLLVIAEQRGLACPTCKEALAGNDPAAVNLARAYGWSILFMMSAPFLIFFGLGTYMFLLVRAHQRRLAFTDSAAGSRGPVVESLVS